MTVNYDITTPDEIDEISPYIHRHWYASRRIVVYDIFDISHDIINEWANLTVETIRAWDPQYPYLAVHNVSRRGVATKYSALPLSIINPAITHDARASLFTTSEKIASLPRPHCRVGFYPAFGLLRAGAHVDAAAASAFP
ncbi:MAG: hypothetical protein HC893_03085 [Chloroflexaceae bacterium]|nr:hypothetical protein [Chloroflexaceae bacterium]